MLHQYRPGFAMVPRHAVVRPEWESGLFYYAPLTDLYESIAPPINTKAQVYGIARASGPLLSRQDSGTKDLNAYHQGPSAALQITASGNNPRLALGATFSNIQLTAPYTVAGWCRADEIASLGAIASHNLGNPNNYALFWDNTAAMFMSFTVGGSFKFTASAAGSVRLGVWTHWVGTYDKVKIRLYKNGVLVSETSETGTPDNANTVHAIGNVNPGSFASRACLLRQVATWTNRCLSPTEVGRLFLSPSLLEDSAFGLDSSTLPVR